MHSKSKNLLLSDYQWVYDDDISLVCDQIMDAGEGGRGEQAPLLPFVWRSKGSKSALCEIILEIKQAINMRYLIGKTIIYAIVRFPPHRKPSISWLDWLTCGSSCPLLLLAPYHFGVPESDPTLKGEGSWSYLSLQSTSIEKC